MPKGRGLRCRTRDLYSRSHRSRGYLSPGTLFWSYRLGEYVDVKVDGAVRKGMPHKSYHGCTGLVWNISKQAIGVDIKKQVRHRKIRKRLYIRIEHVQPSRCREDFKLRAQINEHLVEALDTLKNDKGKEKSLIRRQPKGPDSAHSLLHVPIFCDDYDLR